MATLIASLFSAESLAASFDAEVIHAAGTGRVHRGFAFLAAQTFGLATLHEKSGTVDPISKAAFLKLARLYRETLGQGAGLTTDGGKLAGAKLRAFKQRAHMGAALDAIAIALDPTTPGARGLDDWIKACAPAPKPAKEKASTPAPAVQGVVPVPPAVQGAPAPAATITAQGAASGLPVDAPAPALSAALSMPVADLLAAMLAALAADELSAEQVGQLQAEVSRARSRLSAKAPAPGAHATAPAPEVAPV